MTATYLKRFLILCFVLTVSFAFSQKSKVYKNKKTDLRIKFPCSYTSSTTKKEKYTTYKMTCKDAGISYIATVTAHKLKMNDVKGLVKISLDAFTDSFKGATVVFTKDWRVGKKTGTKRQLLYKGNLLNYYVIIAKNNQYQLIVFGDKDSSDEKTRDAFVKSFKIL